MGLEEEEEEGGGQKIGGTMIVVIETGEEEEEVITGRAGRAGRAGRVIVALLDAGEEREEAGERDLATRECTISPAVKCPMIASNVPPVDLTGRGDRLLGVRDSLALFFRLRDLRE